ncbi:uncharacterized protein LOC124806015 isoform X2 [Hydra vulgaris]|uniref:Uncharacterized protein LOC124806015 isoform X2 n=1 Tax=Hydra vulgaris TaxID=6087 RepID=A0ABM4DHP9_HYDVU
MDRHYESCSYRKTKKKVFDILGIDQFDQIRSSMLLNETTQSFCIKANRDCIDVNNKIKSTNHFDQTCLNSYIKQPERFKQFIDKDEKQNFIKNIFFFVCSGQEQNSINNRRTSSVLNIIHNNKSNNVHVHNENQKSKRSFSSPSLILPNIRKHDRRQVFHDYLQNNIQIHSCKTIRTILKKRIYDLGCYPNFLMHDAAFKCCDKCLKALIKNGCSISQQDESGFIPLHAAVMGENISALTFLLQHNSHVNESSNDGWTALHLAIILNNLKMVHSITVRGGNPYLTTKLGITPFELSIKNKQTLILDYFIYLKHT